MNVKISWILAGAVGVVGLGATAAFATVTSPIAQQVASPTATSSAGAVLTEPTTEPTAEPTEEHASAEATEPTTDPTAVPVADPVTVPVKLPVVDPSANDCLNGHGVVGEQLASRFAEARRVQVPKPALAPTAVGGAFGGHQADGHHSGHNGFSRR
jgi:hypothetical protein